jgi:collagenase-like PrtC family protease
MANFIRPEDLSFYNKLGVHYFKLTGRSKDEIWLQEVLFAYLAGRYEGNLLRLLGISLPGFTNAWEEIEILNSGLNGFLDSYPKTGENDEINYCNNWLIQMEEQGMFRISDEVKESINR